ncbi:hypothetical protein JZ751_012535 [Albula glossodonta]|uniref:Uncharacterized protein n=1 Tax=Albula glossodonta TaxID=121402 RepID=A0A8T2P5W3_9TELE|nr:hypothetical protein JZ751_012535 [Albula glossodonta]
MEAGEGALIERRRANGSTASQRHSLPGPFSCPAPLRNSHISPSQNCHCFPSPWRLPSVTVGSGRGLWPSEYQDEEKRMGRKR